jgi:hypothetical protein
VAREGTPPVPAPPARSPSAAACLAVAIVLTLLQIALAVVATGHRDVSRGYLSLSQWDTFWYVHIAEYGYVSDWPPTRWNPDKANVAFFPAFPLLISVAHRVTGLGFDASALLVSQLACVAFWQMFLLTLTRLALSRAARVAVCALVFCHPAAFFLIAGYSESLFLAGAVAFTHLLARPGPRAWMLAAGSGIVMTASRLPALVVCLASAVVAVARRATALLFGQPPGFGNVASRLALSAVASLGALAFLLYCQVRFGHWNVYLETQKIGWLIRPDYLSVVRLANLYPCVAPQWSDAMCLGRTATAVTYASLLLTTIVGMVTWASRAWASRGTASAVPGEFVAQCLLSAALLLAVATAAFAPLNMLSMLRHTFPVHVLTLLGAGGIASGWSPRGGDGRLRWSVVVVALACALGLLGVQVLLIGRFAAGKWVA